MNSAIPGSTNTLHTINTRTNNSEACRRNNLNNAKISSNTNYEIKDSGFSSKIFKILQKQNLHQKTITWITHSYRIVLKFQINQTVNQLNTFLIY